MRRVIEAYEPLAERRRWRAVRADDMSPIEGTIVAANTRTGALTVMTDWRIFDFNLGAGGFLLVGADS